MTTPQDLLIVALNVPSSREVGQGDLSLALAGAELIDLVEAGVLALEDDRLVPGAERTTGDRLLDEAGASLVRQSPYETVEDWLWRRGRGLAQAYVGALEEEAPTGGTRRHWLRRRSEPAAAVDSPSRRRANERWAAHEPVLVGLAGTLGVGEPPAAGADAPGGPSATVLAAVDDALTELEAVRQRRRIEDEAFDNVWRAP
ncbi:GPP34 family phosphoprotein [Streptomyces spinoverrucosus]|uniref:GOLPH3/VPS74 family protein n=1 Tax=Streptomyces spinoverrucosus TaxID=284043 RepID=UPI0018C3914D|nr:GPP34 family phosphoprotein [Streptomyces spinoverrucosus]MBG0852308.1 GPP34 family phosphoprotein [Streptomyces spinoverrucosus]